MFKFFIVLLCAQVWLIRGEFVTSVNGRQAIEARGPSKSQYSLNLLVGMNSSLQLSTLNNSNAIYWALSRYSNETFYLTQFNKSLPQPPNILTLLFSLVRPSSRNSTIQAKFKCSPSEQECNQITIEKFDLNYLGMYSYQSLINQFDSVFVDFNISTYINSVKLNCFNQSEKSRCLFNSSNSYLSVLSGQPVQIECSLLIAQNSLFEPAAELVISSEVNKYDECLGETQIELLPFSSVSNYLNLTLLQDNVNIVLYKLSKRCDRVFTKYDSNKSYSCELRSKKQQVPDELQKLGVFDTLVSRLDVQYEPEMTVQQTQLFNRTLIAGQQVSVSFSCPFDSNPSPVFEWRLASVVTNASQIELNSKRIVLKPNDFTQSDKDFPIPKDLEIGLYTFECRARTYGLVNQTSKSVQFFLNIIAPPVSAKKAEPNNTGAIIGGVIGGVVALLLIIVLVVFILRRRMGKNTKDEIEKAKDKKPKSSGNSSTNNKNKLNVIDETESSLATNTNLNENSSLANNRASNHHDSSQSLNRTQLPILNITQQKSENEQDGYKKIDEITNSAHDFVFNPSSRVLGPDSSNNGIYSPSTFEARRTDAASKDANLSYMAKLAKQDQTGSPHLGTRGIKVLPTPTPIKSKLNQNPLESPPPYDATYQQPNKNQQLLQQQQQQQQQQQNMGSNSRLLSGSNTPQSNLKHNFGSNQASLSYTATTTPHSLINSTPNGVANSLQHLGFNQPQQAQSSSNLQYTTVQNLARNRNPLNGLEMEQQQQQQQQQQTQYTTMAQLNPIDV